MSKECPPDPYRKQVLLVAVDENREALLPRKTEPFLKKLCQDEGGSTRSWRRSLDDLLSGQIVKMDSLRALGQMALADELAAGNTRHIDRVLPPAMPDRTDGFGSAGDQYAARVNDLSEWQNADRAAAAGGDGDG